MVKAETSLRPGVTCEINRDEFWSKSTDRVRQALAVASEVHAGDTRRSTGEPYVNHCIAVAEILRQWGADEDMFIAGLLHDALEDHPDLISLEQIKEMFGERVAHLVDGVTGENGNDLDTQKKVAREAKTELGIVLMKCADRLHNLLTMGGFSREKQVAKASETLTVYVPLAESLGLWQIKNALADTSFSFTDPDRYAEVKRIIDNDPRLRAEFIEATEGKIRQALFEGGAQAVVEHQVGGYWELSEKQRKSGKAFFDITDVVSFRVITGDENNLSECYRNMGIVRTKLKEMICLNRSDDFLAVPAANYYSALHDTYLFSEGAIEIAYTTKKREEFNNWGVASLSPEELKKDFKRYVRNLGCAKGV